MPEELAEIIKRRLHQAQMALDDTKFLLSTRTEILAYFAPSPLRGEGWGEGLQGWGTTLTLALSLVRERV